MKQISQLGVFFGKILAEERKKQKISQEELAEAIDATNVYICLLEKGQRQPSLNTVILIARRLGMRPEEFLEKVCKLMDE